MNRLRPFRLVLALVLSCVAAPPAPADDHTDHDHSKDAPAAGKSYLPDSAVIARVDDRKISVYDFRDRYFSSEAQTRPSPDSAGRVEFMGTMINRDVLGLTAWKINEPMRFEDRLSLRRFESNVLAQTLFTRHLETLDPVTDAQISEVYPQFGFELRLRYLVLRDLVTAQKVRSDLVAARITWKDAARRLSLGPDSLIDGDLGWISRVDFRAQGAREIFDLRATGLSKPVKDVDGYRLWQCLGRRPATPPPLIGVKRVIARELMAERGGTVKEELFRTAEKRSGVQYDSTNIAWFGDLFRQANPPLPPSREAVSIDLRNRAPEIQPSDTSRVLARINGTGFSVHSFLSIYTSLPAPARVKILNADQVFDVLRRMVLEPQFADMAREEGLLRDPYVVKWVRNREEQLRVQRMYDDSVRVNVSEQSRRDYYEKHRSEFVSRERVTYSSIGRRTEAGADSVISRIRGGESSRAILAADSASGWRYGSTRSLLRGDPNNYATILFDELKPGQSTKIGPGSDGSWVVVHLISFEPSRPMSYAEVAGIVDESLQNEQSEAQLESWLARLRRRHKIESHPESLMKIRLTDPAADTM